MKKQQMYNLIWIVNGKVKEVIEKNKPRPLCEYNRKILKDTTHKLGLLSVQKVK